MESPILDIQYDSNPQNGIFDRLTEISRGNIATKQIVVLSSSGCPQDQLSHLLDDNFISYILTPLSKGKQFLLIDFKDRRFQLSRYYLKTGSFPAGIFHLKSWKIEGSNDNENFTTIDHQKGVEDLNDQNKEFLSPEIHCTEAYRYYRLLVTKNWFHNRRLLLNKIEFFGKLYGSPIKNELAESLNYTSEQLDGLRSLFLKIDSNGNGQLEPEEVKYFFENVVMLPVSLVPIAFRVCDDDNDGSITFDEFAAFYKQLQTLQSPNPLPAYEMLFKALDIDNRGTLNRAEIKQFADFIQMELAEDDLAQIFCKYDTNCHGRLSFETIKQGLHLVDYKDTSFNVFREYNEAEIEKLRKQFDAIDQDGNGSLTQDELAKFCGKDNAEMMFMVYDVDNSGSITFDEFIDFGKKYVEMIRNNDSHLKKSIFDALDEEKSGSLNKEQLARFFGIINIDIPAQELDAFIASRDTNKDGKLTFEEAIQYECD